MCLCSVPPVLLHVVVYLVSECQERVCEERKGVLGEGVSL